MRQGENGRDEKQLGKLRSALRLKGYSAKTIRAYSGHVKRFLVFVDMGTSGLFPGQYTGTHLTERTAQRIFEQCVIAAGIKKKTSMHSLHHSFSTHLLENGTDIRYIQELLGQQKINKNDIFKYII